MRPKVSNSAYPKVVRIVLTGSIYRCSILAVAAQFHTIMPAIQETELTQALLQSAISVVNHYASLGNEEGHGLEVLINSIGTNGLFLRGSLEAYDQDLEAATKGAIKRPFGVEVNTLSPNLQLVLYPRMIFGADEEYIDEARKLGLEIRTEGPQAMLYVLDGFINEKDQVENITANLLFTGYMVGALLEGRYPLATEERSSEFLQEVKEGLGQARRYVKMLDKTTKASLTSRIARLDALDEKGLAREARNMVLYQVEPLKMPGLVEMPRGDMTKQAPFEAVKERVLYLHVTDRDLPERNSNVKNRDVPALPWQEYGRNRWNRSYELFGRYMLTERDQALVVDYKLDSTHFPAKYGFFDTIEIAQITNDGIRQHIILGQRVSNPLDLSSAYPVVRAGKFDFSNPSTRNPLVKLTQDKGTKREISSVLRDVLRLDSKDKL